MTAARRVSRSSLTQLLDQHVDHRRAEPDDRLNQLMMHAGRAKHVRQRALDRPRLRSQPSTTTKWRSEAPDARPAASISRVAAAAEIGLPDEIFDLRASAPNTRCNGDGCRPAPSTMLVD